MYYQSMISIWTMKIAESRHKKLEQQVDIQVATLLKDQAILMQRLALAE